MNNTFLKCGDTNLVGFGTMMTGRAVTTYLNRGVKKSGLTINQIYTLFLIDKFRGSHMSVIAKKGVMDRTTLKRSLDSKSMKDCFLIYKNNELDHRFFYPALTKKGADILEEWMPKVIELEQGLEIVTGDGESFLRFIDFFCSDVVEKNKKTKEQ